MHDPIEESAPPAGRYSITDGDRRAEISTHAQAARLSYSEGFTRLRGDLEQACTRARAALVGLRTDEDSDVLHERLALGGAA